MNTLRPLNTRIVVKPDDPDERSKGGIIIPDIAKTKRAMGTVVAVGPGMLMKSGLRWPMPGLEPGSRVVYSKYAGSEIKLGGVLHVVVRDDDCMAGGPDDKRLMPLMDRVLVRSDKPVEKSSGGIIIPDTAQEKSLEGEVIAVGPGKVLEDGSVRPLDVKTGDRVTFTKFSGQEMTVGGETFMLFHEDDFLGVVEKRV
jgi:chaperonin GroES